MHWSWQDEQAVPVDVLDVVVTWIQQEEAEIERRMRAQQR